jgi:hypothetical protein
MATNAIGDQIRAGKRKLYPFDGTFRHKYPYVPAEAKELPAPAKQLAAGDCNGYCKAGNECSSMTQ